MITFICFIVAFVGLYLVFEGAETSDVTKFIAGLIIAAGFGYAWQARVFAPPPPPTPEEQAVIDKRKAEAEAARQPRLMSEADGCKVYTFWDGGYKHYFTKCADGTVTTDAQRTVRSGKSSKTVTETIVTQ